MCGGGGEVGACSGRALGPARGTGMWVFEVELSRCIVVCGREGREIC